MTDSQKNSATALFGLNIDDLAKLASALGPMYRHYLDAL